MQLIITRHVHRSSYDYSCVVFCLSQAAQWRCIVVRSMQKSIRKLEIRPPPCKIVLPKNSTWNFEHVILSGRLPTMQILVLIVTVGASPHIGEILPLCDFFDCSVVSFFLGHAPRSNRFHALWPKRRVSEQGGAYWGLRRWVTSYGEICLKTPKMALNRQLFRAKTPKCDISPTL